MNCPWCNREMERGVIQSGQEISWFPGIKRRFFGRAEFHRGALELSRLSFVRGSAVVAHLCRFCEKVVIDYGDAHSDLNGPPD